MAPKASVLTQGAVVSSKETEFVIHNFKGQTASFVTSPRFTCLGGTWAMRLYPNGAQKNGIVSMYLYYDGVVGREMDLEGPGLEVEFTFSIKNPEDDNDFKQQHTQMFRPTNGWGFANFISREKALNYLDDNGALHIVCSMPSVIDHAICRQPLSEARDASSHVEKLWIAAQEGKFTDVVFFPKNGEKGVTAHRSVLSAMCPFFDKLLTRPILAQKQVVELNANLVERHILLAFLHYLYTGNTSPSIQTQRDPNDVTIPESHIIDLVKLFKCASGYGETRLADDTVKRIEQDCARVVNPSSEMFRAVIETALQFSEHNNLMAAITPAAALYPVAVLPCLGQASMRLFKKIADSTLFSTETSEAIREMTKTHHNNVKEQQVRQLEEMGEQHIEAED
eukprot:TRINITY_DN35360_c0_g1_i1.p1 TRINITY_DN35360_c0_g1~~TRINITY_DN35360_c0_g1_i1.p1  ORF type:complete len:395 (-),score=51.92 TRINITY_DN35360_c0_g1_i1:11-1195(-)